MKFNARVKVEFKEVSIMQLRRLNKNEIENLNISIECDSDKVMEPSNHCTQYTTGS